MSTGSVALTTSSRSSAVRRVAIPTTARCPTSSALLSTRSDEFRVRWASHDVLVHRSGTKRFHHSLVGDLTLAYERLDLPADPGLVIVTYSAEPGSASEEALRELDRWSTTRAKLIAVEAETEA
jgi:hypothetical protein